MKKLFIVLIIFSLAQGFYNKTFAQANEIAQLALNIEKLLQFKQILKDLKSGYKIVSGGYNTVKTLSEGNFNIHKAFLDGLMEVSPSVRKYRKIAGIVDYQVTLVKEYKAAFKRFKEQNNFTLQELTYIEGVYENLLNSSLENLDELINVTTAGKLRMSDDERLKSIDRIYVDMEDKVSFLRSFNNDTSLLSLAREREKFDTKSAQRLHGFDTQK
ncbi:TerB family tellurite resistance protein [Pedobacter sp.]|jgi:hypothetical protein|uniref:TerB family tellurite resistance protein n=1 Tax=Pedobacter sp. TaxID=1411316 RepID=UPI002BA04DA7|nr:TerB family tellurite resistance protein [Pedobacter sp.]HWW41920.1 hypothetical protein [Pedobacter sp.]